MKRFQTRLIWFCILVTIPLLSVWGRPLQRYTSEKISQAQLAALFLFISIILLGLLGRMVYRQNLKRKMALTVGTLIVFIVIPLFLPTVVERLHFIVFGLFGFLSLRSWSLYRGITICLAVGFTDELLQWWLPDRVGDWRDIGFNWLASLAGCLLAYHLRSRDEMGPAVD